MSKDKKPILEQAVNSIEFETVFKDWKYFDNKFFHSFSKEKELWNYQVEAVKNNIKILWKYYQEIEEYSKEENLNINKKRKKKLFDWYKELKPNKKLEKELAIDFKNSSAKGIEMSNLLDDYYESEKKQLQKYQKTIFSYKNFINRAGLWMATGSGKTVVIVKMIQALKKLIDNNEIPNNDILFLSYRDDLLAQFKNLIEEFNKSNSEVYIRLEELRDYSEVKRDNRLFKDNEITIFYYRSDNISNEQKDKIIDFRNYDNNGEWYIFLDEAHKGDPNESKRQQYYSILSRNGFLFNSSATFTDIRDQLTTSFNFNLSKFIEEGYGKRVSVLKQELDAFQNKEDFNKKSKQKVVLKSLLVFAYIKQNYDSLKSETKRGDLYHNPLMLTLVHTVNTEDADLKLYFRELEKIAEDTVDKSIFSEAKNDLIEEIESGLTYEFSKKDIDFDEELFKKISLDDIRKQIFNSESSGNIEVIRNKSNNKELAFKLVTSDKPFALLKIGDILNWIKEELVGYEVQERYEDESFFENLNNEDSDINILMGSRGFHIGWDSNRPNVINFINIGGKNAQKYTLQSVGRGVRIQPIDKKRKRARYLVENKEMNRDLYNKVKKHNEVLETLFIFGTNKNALENTIQGLNQTLDKEIGTTLNIEKSKNVKNKSLYIPSYKTIDEQTNFKERKLSNFEQLSRNDFERLKNYLSYIANDKILLMRLGVSLREIRKLRYVVRNRDEYFNFQEDIKYDDIELLAKRIIDYFDLIPKKLGEFEEVGNKIKHFKNIEVYLEDTSKIEKKIKQVKKDTSSKKEELKSKYDDGKITFEELENKLEKLSDSKEKEFKYNSQEISIRKVKNHYYTPLILSEEEKIDYITHIINIPSEVRFIKDLEDYINKESNKLEKYDWWMFSKIDETLDEVSIPYYNDTSNQISDFYPDFIFWLKKEDNYKILFVDPKGTAYTDAEKKIDGYRKIFEDNDSKAKVFNKEKSEIEVDLKLRTDDMSKPTDEYQNYWFSNLDNIFK